MGAVRLAGAYGGVAVEGRFVDGDRLMPNPWESRPLYRDLCEGYPGGLPSLRAQAPERPLMGILWQYVTHLSWMVDGAT